MDKYLIGGLLAFLVIALAVWGMSRSWRRRSHRDSGIVLPEALPAAAQLWAGRLQYVASTRAEQPLERVAVPGLRFRGWAQVEVTEAGLIIQVDGERPVALTRETLLGAHTASWAIDRGMGRDGLITVTWQSHSAESVHVTTTLRSADDAPALLAALQQISSFTIPSEHS